MSSRGQGDAEKTRYWHRTLSEAVRMKEWRALDAACAVGEFPLQLPGWDRARHLWHGAGK